MRSNRKHFFGIVSALMLLVMACSLFASDKSSSGDSDKYLGDEYSSKGGGFSIRKAKDYDFKDVIGIVNMVAPGGNDKVGPGIIVMGGLTIKGTTNESLMEKVSEQSGELKVGKPTSTKVAGVEGFSADISGSYEGTDVKGKMVVAMVTDEQQFTMMGFSPSDKWNDLSPVFDAVLGSVKFFDPDPNFGLEPEPVTEEQPEEPSEEALAESVTSPDSSDAENSAEFINPTARPGELRQWAVSARASSQYGNPDWAASQATGEPDVTECGDNVNAWASYGSNTKEWIELTYETPVVPTEINIFQNYNPSQVVEVQMIATDGKKYIVWEGEPVLTEYCPDQMTITIELTKMIKVNKLRITIDQRIMGWGWDEIDAVELVGTSDMAAAPAAAPKATAASSSGSNPAAGKPAPTNYTGWMAGKNYQGFVNVVINKTKQTELDGLIGLKGKKSTENFKPRPDHKDTYIYEFPDGMKVYIGVLTNGLVYKKSIAPASARPKDYKLDTVTKANYDKLDAIYKKDKVILYADMANLLKSPGFLRESYFADDVIKSTYEWYAPNGDRMSGFFLNGRLTGMAGLAYIPAE